MEPKVEVDPEQGLLIEWPDGHQSRYAFDELRGLCPCAACRDRGGTERGLRILETASPQTARLVRLIPVGRYALSPVWADGHATGIYSWDYLRQRCGCLACRLARTEEPR